MLHSILFTQILKIIACYLINNTKLIYIFVVCRLWIIGGIKIRSSLLYIHCLLVIRSVSKEQEAEEQDSSMCIKYKSVSY